MAKMQRFFERLLESNVNQLEDVQGQRGSYCRTPRSPGVLNPSAPAQAGRVVSAPLKPHRKLHERMPAHSHTRAPESFETCKSSRSGNSAATHSSGTACGTRSPDTLSPQSPMVSKGTTPRRFSTGMPTSSTSGFSRHTMASASRAKQPRPPSGPGPNTTTPSRHRWLGPMPEGPPASVLQARPDSGVAFNRAAIGALRSRRYMPSTSPPPADGGHTSTGPTCPPTNLPKAPIRRSTSVTNSPRTNPLLTPRENKRPLSARGPAPSCCNTSHIRHKSSTPVRVTKDIQMSREERRHGRASSSRQTTPRSGSSMYTHESPLRRRTTVAASPNERSSSLARAKDTIPVVPPIGLPPRGQSMQRSESCTVTTTPRTLNAVPVEMSAAVTDGGGMSSTISGSIMGTPCESARHSGEKGAGQLSRRDSNVRNSLTSSSAEQLLEGYDMGPVIGEGGFCKVKRAKHIVSGQNIAVKVINKRVLKDKHDWRRVGREIRILKRLKNHPAIIHVYDVVSLPNEVYVIQELAQGGSLLDYVRDRKRVSEQFALRFFLQIVAGLQFCHEHEVVHRDIKLENLLMDTEGNMKIIDFGLAAIFTPGKTLKVHCGSPSYAAPEIIGRKSYRGPPVDVWSLGIVTFAMVCGHLPFYSRSGRSDLSRKIMAGKYAAPDYMSEPIKDIVAGMLTLDPEQRLTLPQLCTHRWVTGSLASRNVCLPCALLSMDESTGEYQYDTTILDHMSCMGIDRTAVIADLADSECNEITATYFLLAEACRDGRGLPTLTKSMAMVGRTLVGRAHAAQTQHGFSLDVDDAGDRDDQAHFAPSRHRRSTVERTE